MGQTQSPFASTLGEGWGEGTPLADSLARRITYLRLSLTDRCNYRCTYCMPEEGVDFAPHVGVLTLAEIARLMCVFARLGVQRVRLTGGEPTVRQDVVECVAALIQISGIREVVMTTNGHRLPELAASLVQAGLAGLNVSLDTLNAEKFRHITRRGDLSRVLAGIECAHQSGIRSIKLNMVVLRDFNDDEIGAMCEYAWARGLMPRFIEWMPLSGGAHYAGNQVVRAAEVRDRVSQYVGLPVIAEELPPGSLYGPARYFHIDEKRRFGIISAMSENFCGTCNRVRVTASGQLHACLAYDEACDLRGLLRSNANDDALRRAIQNTLWTKRPGHNFAYSGAGAPRKHMIVIGG